MIVRTEQTTRQIAVFVFVTLLFSCQNATVYNSYRHTQIEGWKKAEQICFHVPSMQDDGVYNQYVGIRLTDLYPFQTLSLIVRQTIYPKKKELCDTLLLEVIDEQGQLIGNGLNISQIQIPLKTLSLKEGDSLSVNIQHNMRRDILKGISDIGLKIEHAK